MKNDQCCGSCLFVRYVGGGGPFLPSQVCGRHAPIGVLEDSGYLRADFPPIPCPPWCGDWQSSYEPTQEESPE